MEQSGRRVAIVGCGVSGLTSIKHCLEEGMLPCCFETNSDLGGVWYTSDSPKYGGGPQMYDSLITNTSKALTCFSDFPCPASYPPYLPHALLHRYLRSYAEHFRLEQHVTFNTKVLEVRKADDFNATGRWMVTTCRLDCGTESEDRTSEIYDAVMLCQGFFSLPVIPDIPGLSEGTPGRVLHVSSYENSQPFKGKTVVVVGSGSSAGDVACDIAPVAKQVYLSVHHGAYVISRVYKGFLPVDFRLSRIIFYLPAWLMDRVLFNSAAQWLNPVTSGLQPESSLPVSRVNLLINDQLPFKVFSGQVKVVSEIRGVQAGGEELHLKDGKVLKEVDHILFATGYRHDFSVVDPAILTSDPKSGKLELYKMVFPVSLSHDSLAVVGCLRGKGPLPPLLEIQARLAARVLAGRHRLPETAVRQRDIDRVNRQQLDNSGRYKYEFVPLALSDDIAAEFGAKPVWWRLLLQGDVSMAWAVMFGPAFPFHYRLTSPHPWAGAREAVLKAREETLSSTQHRRVGGGEKKGGGKSWGAVRFCLVLLSPVVLAGAVRWFFWG